MFPFWNTWSLSICAFWQMGKPLGHKVYLEDAGHWGQSFWFWPTCSLSCLSWCEHTTPPYSYCHGATPPDLTHCDELKPFWKSKAKSAFASFHRKCICFRKHPALVRRIMSSHWPPIAKTWCYISAPHLASMVLTNNSSAWVGQGEIWGEMKGQEDVS